MKDSARTYCFLGYSSAAVAMALESLEQTGDHAVNLLAVENLETQDTSPVHTEHLSITRVWHESWHRDHSTQAVVRYLMGVYRPKAEAGCFWFLPNELCH